MTREFQFLAISTWSAAILTGLTLLYSYAGTPGESAAAPARWPVESAITPVGGRATLVMFVHPRCPCSRASLGELALVLAQARAPITCRVVFVRPPGTSEEWVTSDLWAAASAMPGVEVLRDETGADATRFNARTSGHVLLYDPQGQLRFSGGITAARGHAGENAGRNSLVALLNGDQKPAAGGLPAAATVNPVFGCPVWTPCPTGPGQR